MKQTYEELESRILALEAQIKLLALQVAAPVQPYAAPVFVPGVPLYQGPWSPLPVTCGASGGAQATC